MTLNNYNAVAAIAGMLVLGSAGKVLAADEVKPPSRALIGTWLVQVQAADLRDAGAARRPVLRAAHLCERRDVERHHERTDI